MMKTMKLGRTNLVISRIGVGGIPITRLSESKAVEVLRRCFDLGVTFVDTANAYGSSEERIGKAITGYRNKVVIATKTGGRSKTTALEHLELSLQRLQTDYIDLWQLHNLSTFKVYKRVLRSGGAMEAAQEALKTGKIRHIGMSSHSLDVALHAVPSGNFETIQFPFNFVNTEAADELIPLCQEHDIGFIAMKPFAGGQLSDADLVIKYLLQFDGVVPDPGVKECREIEEIVDIVNGSWKLTPRENGKIEEIRFKLGRRFCQWCGYCQPCPQDIDIPHLMNTRNIRSYGEGFFKRVARAVEAGRNCVECGECEEKCPYHLPIRETIAENIEFFDRLMQEVERPWEEAN